MAFVLNSLNITLLLCLLSGSIFCRQESIAPVKNTGLKCECAAFLAIVVGTSDTPVVAQNPMNTTCDEEGRKNCHTMCQDLVKLGKERAPGLLCENLGHAESIKPSLFVRVCEKEWSYGGITAETPICCHDKKPVQCRPISKE